MNSARHILIVSKGFPPDLGGIETYALEIARTYRASGCRVVVITQFNGAGGWQEVDGLTVFNGRPGSQARLLLTFCSAIREAVRRFGPFDLVHATTWRTALAATIAGRNAPLVITVHGREVGVLRGPLRCLCRWSLAQADRILVISRETQRRCQVIAPAVAGPTAVVAWNGISISAPQPRSKARAVNSALKVLTSCRLTPMKNVAAVLRAAADVRDGMGGVGGVPAFEVVITGDGEERAALDDLRNRLRLNNVRLLGRVSRDELMQHYQTADIFLHPQASLDGGRAFEGFCVAVADAMAQGIATIAGRDGAPAEYITHGENGCLVDGRDRRDVAATLASLLKDAAARAKMGTAARTFADANFSWARHIKPALALLEGPTS